MEEIHCVQNQRLSTIKHFVSLVIAEVGDMWLYKLIKEYG